MKVAVVIELPNGSFAMGRYELTDFESKATELFLPNKPRGVPRCLIPAFDGAIFSVEWKERDGPG